MSSTEVFSLGNAVAMHFQSIASFSVISAPWLANQPHQPSRFLFRTIQEHDSTTRKYITKHAKHNSHQQKEDKSASHIVFFPACFPLSSKRRAQNMLSHDFVSSFHVFFLAEDRNHCLRHLIVKNKRRRRSIAIAGRRMVPDNITFLFLVSSNQIVLFYNVPMRCG